MDDEIEDNYNIEEDYYAFLNIPRNATSEQINAAYRNLSRIYHPDKHVNDDKKVQAELLFNRTKKAYEVLSDPHKRVIYDCLGTKGLETEGWEIIHRTRTPAEIREEYERLAQDREERKLQQKTNPKGNITVNINATDIFNSYDDDEDYNQFSFSNIEVSGMSISQSIEAPFNTRDTTIISGNLSSHNGVGNGSFALAGRRLINKGWLELDVGAGNGPSVAFKGFRNLTPKMFCNGGININFRPNGVIPGLVGTLAVQLNKNTIGYLTYNASIQSSMSTIIERTTETNHMLVNLTIGVSHCFVFASYTKKLDDYKLRIRLATKIGTFGYLVEYGVDKRISKYSTIGATVLFGVPSGVTLRIKYTRSSQTFLFPIHLSEEIVPSAIFYATITPILGWMLIKQTLIDPMNAEKKRKEIERTKQMNKIRMNEKQKEAEAAIELMSSTYDRICREEKAKNGLIIVSAIYGNVDNLTERGLFVVLNMYRLFSFRLENSLKLNDTDRTHSTFIINVTVPLQCLVKDSKLVLHDQCKSELPGFYDPCVGEEKYLHIEYSYENIKHNIQITDKEPLRLPIGVPI